MNAIPNCDEYLATVFTECCVENCGEDNTIGIIIGSVITVCICISVYQDIQMKSKSIETVQEVYHKCMYIDVRPFEASAFVAASSRGRRHRRQL